MTYIGDFAIASTITFGFTSVDPASGQPKTMTSAPAVSVYKGTSTTESTAGITLTVDFDGRVGYNVVSIDTSADGTFYATASDFRVVLTNGAIGAISIVGYEVGSFSLANRSALRPTTAGRTFNVGSTGVGESNQIQVDGVANATHASGMNPADARDILGTAISTPATAGILDVNVKNMNNVAATSITTINANQGTTQPVNYTGTGASALVKSDTVDIAGAAVNTALAQVGVNVVSQANIDFGALQKASLNAATPASVVGAVGSVTGNVGGNVNGNVVGSVASVTARVTANTDQWAGGTIPAPAVTGVPKIDLTYILGTILTETAGQIAAGFKKFFNIASPTSTMNQITLVDTTTNLTNAPTNGDFTAVMKTSLNAATPTASLSAAAIQAIWDKATSALTTVGSIGKLLVDNINATISSRLAPTVAGRTADINANGNIGIDWGNVDDQGASVTLANTYIQEVGNVDDVSTIFIDRIWNALLVDYPTAGSMGSAMNEIFALPDAVWDELIAGHLGAGSTGKALNDAATGAAVDPWAMVLPGAYAVGEAGYIVGTYLDSKISDVPTANENADGLLDRASAIDGYTPRNAWKFIGAATAGKVSGSPTTPVFRAMDDSADRIAAVTTATGDRTAITLTP